MENQSLLTLLFFTSYLGIYITASEWNTIWARGRWVGLGRLLVFNLPIAILLNLILLGEKI